MADGGRRVAITGASGYVGFRLVERLAEDDGVELVLATDVRPPAEPHFLEGLGTGSSPSTSLRTGLPQRTGEGVRDYGAKVAYRRYDVTEPAGALFADHGIDSVVHLAYVLEPRRDRDAVRRVNLGGAENVLDACDRAPVSYFLYLSSTSVYGAHPDNPDELTEESPPRPVRGFQYSEEKLESERLIEEYGREHPDCGIAILRGCPVLGPDADNYIARSFLSPVFVGFMGEDPPMQFMHEDDLVEIMARCVLERVTGLYNAAGRGAVRWSRMAQSLGRPRVCLPAPLLMGVTWASWTLGLQSKSPAPGLSYARYRWVASPERLRDRLGYTRERTSEETWEEFARNRGSAGRGPARSRGNVLSRG